MAPSDASSPRGMRAPRGMRGILISMTISALLGAATAVVLVRSPVDRSGGIRPSAGSSEAARATIAANSATAVSAAAPVPRGAAREVRIRLRTSRTSRSDRATGRRGAPTFELSGRRPAPPARITIPAAGIDAAIEAVAQTAGGIEVPPVGRGGWFDAGPRPGEVGRVVIVGHVDSRQGPAAFTGLPGVRRGAVVSITDRAGTRRRYRVSAKTAVRKARFPARAVYGPTTRRLLVLITCGGPYRRGTGYRDNVLVHARAI